MKRRRWKMDNHNELKAKRKKELLVILESKKKDLQMHFEKSASKSVDAGKGLLAVGFGVLLLYTIFDRFLESKFKVQELSSNAASKQSSNKILYPIFSMLLQQAASALFEQGQKRMLDYLKNKKQTHERLPRGISKKK